VRGRLHIDADDQVDPRLSADGPDEPVTSTTFPTDSPFPSSVWTSPDSLLLQVIARTLRDRVEMTRMCVRSRHPGDTLTLQRRTAKTTTPAPTSASERASAHRAAAAGLAGRPRVLLLVATLNASALEKLAVLLLGHTLATLLDDGTH
jgi:hypothetical protein